MKDKKITIVALVVGILALTIGFAAFSNIVTISQSASVNPDNNLNVVFSRSNNRINLGDITLVCVGYRMTQIMEIKFK